MPSSSSKPTASAPMSLPLTLGTPQKAPYQVTRYTIEVNRYHIYLSDDIGEPLDYVEICDLLRNAEEHDVIYLHLNTSGGRLDTGLQLINAIRDCAARVVTVIDPHAYSMGALLFLAGDEMVVPEHAMLMFHNYSSGLIGKGNEQLAEVHAASRSFEKVMKKICQPFLSADEVKSILHGQDLWLDADDIRKRLQRMQQVADAPDAAPAAPRRARKADAATKPARKPASDKGTPVPASERAEG